MAIKQGWQGRSLEHFATAETYRSFVGRTVTEADNILLHVAPATTHGM